MLTVHSSSGSAPCSVYTPSSSIPAGFGSPYDVAFSSSTNLIRVSCGTSSVRVDLGSGTNNPDQYIYHTGYLYKTGLTDWAPISYTSTETLISRACYPKSANTTIQMTSTELANPSYVLGHVCTWTGSAWKCGCRDAACTQSYWQVQSQAVGEYSPFRHSAIYQSPHAWGCLVATLGPSDYNGRTHLLRASPRVGRGGVSQGQHMVKRGRPSRCMTNTLPRARS
jgi:hypothetical protein